ncbi:hypothetical protein, partial [Paenibacillus chibensis]|uniref:hypothetical protein n=1 Tax=Paenibacillus chibensis TaxID=59846 RepID=UPI003D276E9F
ALRFGFIAEACISLVVQFSKIKFFRFRSRSVSSAATLIIYHVFRFNASFFFKALSKLFRKNISKLHLIDSCPQEDKK